MSGAPAPPSLPPSPPRPPAQGTLSKIPRRRPSTQLANSPILPPSKSSSPSRPPSRSVSLPPSTPSSPVKGHVRRSSRSHMLPPLDDFPAAAHPHAHAPHTPLQDRRRVSTSSASGPLPPPEMRRTPSLSIYIPHPPPPSSSSSAQHATQRPLPTQPRSARTRPSPTSGSSTSSPWTPHARRASQPLPGTGWARPPRTPYPKRPAMIERTPSASTVATYTSFDLPAPCTPREERERLEAERRARRGWWGRWFAREGVEEEDVEAEAGERTALLGARVDGQEGGTTWRYVLGETWCYAKHMLPPILFFVVLVLVIALFAYRQAVHRIIHPPEP